MAASNVARLPMATPPPANEEAEESVLGAMLVSEKALEVALADLSPEMFYRPSNATIFTAARLLYEGAKPVDVLTLADRLAALGSLPDVGGLGRMNELAAVGVASNVAHHCRLVREAWGRRLILAALREQVSEERWASVPAEWLHDIDTIGVELRSKIERDGRDTVVSAAEAAERLVREITSPNLDELSVPTPLPLTHLRPFKGGRLYVLGGYSSDGKTSFACQCARAACDGGIRTGIVSIEMSERDLTDRIASTFGIPHHVLQFAREGSAKLRPQDRDPFAKATAWLGQAPLDIIDDAGADATSIRRYQRAGRYQFLIVDHLHRIDVGDDDNRRARLERQVRSLTNLARDEEIPLLLVAQLSRSGRDFPRPTMASFRESGVIEQEAALAMAVWRKRDKHGIHDESGHAELLVVKNRFGGVGLKHLHFNRSTVSFEAAAREATT